MKIRSFFAGIFYTLMCVGWATAMHAQVTIGTLEKPIDGSLLQLKNIPESEGNNVNSDKGLLLPRVHLTSISDLYPMFPIEYDKGTQDPLHTGLIVYNVNEELYNGDGAGMYYWDGEKWYGLGLTRRSISVSPSVIYISENTPRISATLTTTPAGLPWEVTTSNVVNSSSYVFNKTDRKYNLIFQRDQATAGNKTYTFKLKHSDKRVSIEVKHIKLTTKEIIKVGEDAIIESSSLINAEGGDESWFVKEYTASTFNWTKRPENKNGSLSFSLGKAKREGIVEGSITIAHINDPNYTKVIKIQQNKDYVVLPEFDYLVIQYKYGVASGSSADLDTATELVGTGVINQPNTNDGIDYNPAGWNVGVNYSSAARQAKGLPFLHWGGDNQRTGYETVYANMSTVRDEILEDTAPRVFNVNMYGTWYTPDLSKATNNKISIYITLYKGGTMKKVNTYDYENSGGKKVFTLEKTNIPVTTYKGVGNFRNDYSKLLSLEYDRIENTGVLVPLVAGGNAAPRTYSTMQRSVDPMEAYKIPFEMLPNESKDEYAKRCEAYREKARKEIERQQK